VDDDSGRGRLSFLGTRVPAAFAARAVTIAPGTTLPFDAAAWRDTIVVVERGEVELESAAGARLRCRRGDVLWLSGLSLVALHNPGEEAAVLSAVRRSACAADEFPGPPASQAP
jgi:hypothetical protein